MKYQVTLFCNTFELVLDIDREQAANVFAGRIILDKQAHELPVADLADLANFLNRVAFPKPGRAPVGKGEI